MNKPNSPPPSYLTIQWNDLETVLRELSITAKHDSVPEILEDIQNLYRTQGSTAALFELIAATAWLTDDGRALKKSSLG